MTHRKLSISLARPLLNRLEKHRRKSGWNRSEAIQFAVERWLDSIELDRATADYIAGYVRVPEDGREGQALLRAQVVGLEPEDWA